MLALAAALPAYSVFLGRSGEQHDGFFPPIQKLTQRNAVLS